MNRFEKKNTILIKTFGDYLRGHPEILDGLPDEALLVMHVEGDAAFNAWSRRIAQPESGQPVVFVRFTLKQGSAKGKRTAEVERLELQPVA